MSGLSKTFPPRPYLPLPFISGMMCWMSGAASFLALGDVPGSILSALLVFAALAALASVALLLRSKGLLGSAALGLTLGLLCSCAHCVWIEGIDCDDQARDRVFLMEQDSKEYAGRQIGLARIVAGPGSGHLVEITCYGSSAPLLYGQSFQVTSVLQRANTILNARLWEDGVVARTSFRDPDLLEIPRAQSLLGSIRGRAIQTLETSNLDRQTVAVLQALSCGYRVSLNNESIYESFKVSGLAHLVAVSGAHLSIVVVLVESLLKSIGMPRRVRILFEALLIGVFLLFAAAPLSALRASMMAWASLASYFPGRRSSSLSAIGVLLMVICAVWPPSLCSVSMLLSAGSTIGIVLFAPLMLAWAERLIAGPRFIKESLALTLSSGVVAGPISACLFSQVVLVSPLANVLSAPLFAAACAAGLFGTLVSTAVPAVSAVALPLCSLPAQALCFVVRACGAIPYGCIAFDGQLAYGLVGALVSGVVLWLAWARLYPPALAGVIFAPMALMAFLALFSAGVTGPSVTMLDVGQGDAILVRDGRRSLLIDTGTNDDLLKRALARQGVFHLDGVVVTHGDDDHDGSLVALSHVVEINAGYVFKDALTCQCGNCSNLRHLLDASVGGGAVVGLEKGDILRCGRFALEVVWPKEYADKGGNSDSLCLSFSVDVDSDGNEDASGLLCGDAESETLNTLINEGLVGKVDLYKVGHHGSKVAIDQKAAGVLNPEVSLISVGANNRYGHPSQEALGVLNGIQSKIYRTDERGDIACLFRVGEIQVTTQK